MLSLYDELERQDLGRSAEQMQVMHLFNAGIQDFAGLSDSADMA
jgi:hypothetical protein